MNGGNRFFIPVGGPKADVKLLAAGLRRGSEVRLEGIWCYGARLGLLERRLWKVTGTCPTLAVIGRPYGPD